MKENKKIFIQCLIVFIFFMFIGIIIPYSGDDWGNALGDGTLLSTIKTAIQCYNTFEGRFFSRIFVTLLNYYKILWIFVNAISMTVIYYFILKLVKPKNFVFTSVLILDLILLIDEETFAQVYAWITGNITYLIPTAFLMFLIYFNRNIFNETKKRIKTKKIYYFILPILTFMFSMFVENVTLGIITVLLLIVVYKKIYENKYDVLNIVCLLFSLVGFLLMLYSPGTMNRAASISSFDSLNLFEKIMITFPRQMNYVFIKNSFLIFLSIILINIIILKNYKGIKKYFLLAFFTIIPLITILGNIYYIFYRYPPKNFIGLFLDCNNWYIMIYWIMFLIIFIVIIVKNIKFNKKKVLFFFLVALLNSAGLLMSPISGGRTSYLTTLMLIICISILIDSLNLDLLYNKKFLSIHKCLLVTIICLFIVNYFKYYSINIKRELYIKNQIYKNEETINIIKMPERYLWNPNPWDETHMINFKKYYSISEEKKVKILNIWECDDL